MKSLLTSIVFFSLVALATSQPLRSVPYDMMIETADGLVATQDYYNAIEWYEKAYKESRDIELATKLAYLNYALRNYRSAENYFKRFLRRDDENLFAEERFIYGMTLKAQGKYPEAVQEFNSFLELSEDDETKKLAQFELKGIEKARTFEENIEVVVNFGGTKINSAFTEYSPRLFTDGTLYFSAIPSRKAIEIEGNNEDQFSKIFTSSMGKKEYEKPTALGNHINREGFHTGNVSFSKDGQRMYFTRMQLYGNELESSIVYVSYRNGADWSPPIDLSDINGDFIVKHPVVGELFGNEVLFFTSNMDGGFGGDDIYYSTRQGEGTFSSPVNLGEKINSTSDDITPFYRDGSLYFSSNGHPGMGGFDIFKTTWDGTGWSDIENLGFNYNTSFDDMFLSFNESGSKGFLVSNRPAKGKRNLKSPTCCDDIYSFTIRDIVIDLLTIVEDQNGPLDGANVTLLDLSAESDPSSKSNDDGNEFRFLLEGDRSYTVQVSREGYYPNTVDFNTAGIIDDYTVRKKVVLEPVPPAEPEIEIVTINQPIRLNNIYYNFDKWDILPDAKIDLKIIQELMNQYPDMVIELSSHTDAQGISTYNQNLSQKRAESAKAWLVQQGITDQRINAVGYGEEVILNHCVNGVRCTDDEHRFNRRTEFKIIAGPTSVEIKREVRKDQGQKKN